MTRGEPSLTLCCPSCHAVLESAAIGEKHCPVCRTTYRRNDGIWTMMAEERQALFRRFIDQYETVRRAEGRCVQDAAHLRALPFRDLSGARRYEWSVRGRSFSALLRRVIEPLERARGRPLAVLDLGSGLGWLAYRLTLRGHAVAAVDLLTNDFDGLGVHRHYDREFLPVQAEFDRLPFGDGTLDAAVYNASFHYARDYAATLREALRVLGPGGCLIILDTPLYRDGSSGRTMVREREQQFQGRFGFRGDSLGSEGYLTYDRLEALARELGLEWELVEPWYGVRWWLKPVVARLRRTREPARFKLIVGRRAGVRDNPGSPPRSGSSSIRG